MGSLNETKKYETIRVKSDDDNCFLTLYRPDADNTINERMIEECSEVLTVCEDSVKILVLEGLPDVFCFGADFRELGGGQGKLQDPGPLFDLWLKLATGPYVTIAHVRGKVNAGGIGFVAASDIVICDEKATFSLSELLFGLMPACVLPFLIRRIGISKANYMTLMTQPISAQLAFSWGLVDVVGENTENLLRKHLLRLRRLTKIGVAQYKAYMGTLNDFLAASKPGALKANLDTFSDPENLRKITRYVITGKFPWEQD